MAAGSNKDLLERFLNAFPEGADAQALFLAEDAVVYEAKSLKWSGRHNELEGELVGKDGFHELIETMSANIGAELKTIELIDAGDRVIAEMVVRWSSLYTGESIEDGVLEVYSFKDGKISAADVYYKNAGRVAALAMQTPAADEGAEG